MTQIIPTSKKDISRNVYQSQLIFGLTHSPHLFLQRDIGLRWLLLIKKYIGPKHLTRFERSRIIGARALQLSQGAPRLVNPPPEITNSIVIAELELQERILPLTIRRTLPSGEYVDISLKTLTQVSKPATRRRKKA